MMQSVDNSDLLDTVLTLRGHQITLRQAIADGIIKGYFDPVTGKTEIVKVDSNWILEQSKQRGEVS
jgi:hypothetical protein